ncbi:hypothetical protein E2542_SST05010 [Spatholobus suberectus]|nr:hypothetical protein E2542_SST05010 [Spatholobus suberectus]
MVNIPLFKYVSSDGSLSYCSVNDCNCTHGAKRLVLADPNQSCPCSWLISWNKEFACAANHFFMPEITQQVMLRFADRHTLLDWLANQVNVTTTLNVYTFAEVLCRSIENNSKLAITYAHFLYHSFSKGYLSVREVDTLCGSMPLVDNYGCVNKIEKRGSRACKRQTTDCTKLIKFLTDHLGASDIPDIYPPNAGFPSVNAPLTKDNAFLLLDWIRKLKYRGVSIPERFLKCIKEGSWLKVTVNGWMPPSKSFLIGSSLGRILQTGSALVDIPLVDETFYGNRIREYVEELKTIGVMFSYEEACEFIGRELMHRAASSGISRSQVILMLKFIQHQRESLLPVDKFVNSIRNGSWLKTSHGLRSPAYFGEEIYNFQEELKLLRVIVGFSGNYKVVIDHLKSPSNLANLTAKAVLLIMECIKYSSSSSKLINSLMGTSCLKTNMGFKTPGECFLYDPVWGCILEVFNGLPVIDHKFYGNKIFTYKGELKQIGVVVDFEEAIKKFAHHFKQKASQTAFNQQHVKSFLSCCRLLKLTQDLLVTVRNQKWLLTKVGSYRCPRDCILDGVAWKSISFITRLPFIDDGDNCYGKGIHEYKEELKSIGVVTELKDGVKFVPKCLNFPLDPSTITPESVFSLLECIRLQIQGIAFSIDDDFRKRLPINWLKTHAGYRSPDKCLLFDSKWNLYLSERNWKPEDKAARKIWIPESANENDSLVKYATYFSEAISEGVLRENHDHVAALSELITLAFVLEFNDEEIEFLMESKNLQIFCVDDEFIGSYFLRAGDQERKILNVYPRKRRGVRGISHWHSARGYPGFTQKRRKKGVSSADSN